MNSIGEVIKKYRQQKKLTQEELGRKLFVTKQAVSKWENGKSLPDIITMKKLSEILLIPHDEVLGESIRQTKRYRKWIALLIPVMIASFILAVFFAFDGVGLIQRRIQSGIAIITLRENGSVISADDYGVTGVDNLKPGKSGYSFSIDYGEVKGSIATLSGEEIEFGFINTNNWHNVQISINIDRKTTGVRVSQTIVYRTDKDFIVVYETKDEMGSDKKACVFHSGV